MIDIRHLIREARTRAGLSQRELAHRAETAQSVIARIELGQTNPTWETLNRIVKAAGFDLDVELALKPVLDSHMLRDIDRILSLSPEARLEELAKVSEFVVRARRA